ncbi:MAG: ATP synthase F1 subunit gamma [Bacteroidales bacterium]|nr:MAG: ATP synthase F1 subunit gamma [Bacteroidales bacterium]
MANLKEIRTRISSVSSTKKITSAMKMVSAAKFKKAQNGLIKFRPFNEKIHQLVEGLFSLKSKDSNLYFSKRKDLRRIAIVLITSNNSMCGAFNANIIKTAIQTHKSIQQRYNNVEVVFFCLGKKGEEVLKRNKLKVVQVNPAYIDKPKIDYTRELFDSLFAQYKQGKIDRIEIVSNKFKNAATQIQVVDTLLPIPKAKTVTSKNINNPIIEPEPIALLSKLLPYYLINKLHSAILESSAAEHGARMTAMHQATENASTLLNNLILDYNKVRQAAITNEILEIVSGANAQKE